jgi:hypothetical protein
MPRCHSRLPTTAFSFTNFQAANPNSPPPGSAIDGEFNNAKAMLDGIATTSHRFSETTAR